MLPTRADREANQHSWPWFKAGATALASRMGAKALMLKACSARSDRLLASAFRAHARRVQPTSGIDHQAQRSLLLQPAAELLKVAVAAEIQSGLTASPRATP